MSANDPQNDARTSSGDISEPLSTVSVGSDRILYVRLPCNPIFPIGVVYLSDHIHKIAPHVQQNILILAQSHP